MSTHGGGQDEAARWLEIAERLLRARDLFGSKRFAERAVEADPLIVGADHVIATAEVLLASQRRINNHVDWYAVLQLDPSSPDGRHPSAVLRQYRRLALLLHPDRNHLDGASFAAKLVSDAWAVLSDPSKNALFDAELDLATVAATAASAAAPPPPVLTFWTACPSCCHLHQYGRDYEGKNLRCPNCRRAFHATPLQAEPPIVPGADMYYCSWGFVPLGFAGGASSEWKPFHPMFQVSPCRQPQPPNQRDAAPNPMASTAGETTAANVTSVASTKRAVAKKKAASSLRKRVLVSEAGTRSSERIKARTLGIDMNAEA